MSTSTSPAAVEPRRARCGSCGNTIRSSAANLAFFEDLSPEAEAARPLENRSCAACGFKEGVHHEVNTFTGRPGITDHPYVPKVYEFDRFYCGCHGWD